MKEHTHTHTQTHTLSCSTQTLLFHQGAINTPSGELQRQWVLLSREASIQMPVKREFPGLREVSVFLVN